MMEMNNEQKEKVNGKFNSFKNGNFSKNDQDTVLNHYDEILEKANLGALRRFVIDIRTMCSMVKAWSKKEYKKVPVNVIGMIILTLVYVFLPADVIPDFIPGIGVVDDAAMVGLCLAAAKADIEDFRNWAKANNPKWIK